MSVSLNFRAMTHQDLDTVVAIENNASQPPWTPGNFRDSLDNGHFCQLLTDDSDNIMGYVIGYAVAGEAHLLTITVAREHQGKKLGKALLQHIVDWSEQQAETLFLEVRVSNQTAINLYLGAGFNELGIRRNYYPCPDGSREDAMLMALDLGFGDFS
ncbi:ribosomal protein S18-alanine N-acetyltransferase [Endozoicomonadaceae bacterium StTr2]